MKQILIQPDYQAEDIAFRHTWSGLANILQFHFLHRKDILDQLAQAHDEIGVRHVRAVGMFDDSMHVYAPDPTSCFEKGEPQPVENWSQVDIAIRHLLEIGVKPMFTTCFTPSRMASGTKSIFTRPSNVTPPRDFNRWRRFVRNAVRHMVEQFGLEEVRSWYFEVWNEPNLYSFWSSDQAEWFVLWKMTYGAIKEVDANLRVGGPSSARGEWLGDLLHYGDANDCSPDYLITHVYNNDSESKPLSPFEGSNADKGSKSPHFAAGVVRGVRQMLREVGFKGEVHWNEWGASWFPYAPDRETENEAAFIAKTMAEVSQEADFFSYWNLTDIYDHAGFGVDAFHGYYGLLNRDGLRKPGYCAHQLLGRLGNRALPVKVKGGDRLLNGLATCGDKGHRVLVYAYHDPHDEAALSKRQDLRVEIPLPGNWSGQARAFLIDQTRNNILHSWRSLGSPAYPSAAQVAELEEANKLEDSPESVEIIGNEGNTTLHLRFQAPGMALVEF